MEARLARKGAGAWASESVASQQENHASFQLILALVLWIIRCEPYARSVSG
jgi:hypothetical protein